MDTSNIPRIFWYSLSFCMVVTTVVLLTIAFKSSAISIEIASAKIELSSAIAQTKEIKNDLKLENERLISANKSLEQKLRLLEVAALNPMPGGCPEEICGANSGDGDGDGGGKGGGSGGSASGNGGKSKAVISIEDIKKHGILGGRNSEIRKTEIPQEWFDTLDAKIESAEQALK